MSVVYDYRPLYQTTPQTLVTTTAPPDELINLDEAKAHLGILVGDHDERIMRALKAAREWCEGQVSRTLRPSTTRTATMANWFSRCWQPPFPPLLTVSSIKYYDSAGVDTTLASSEYTVLLSTEGPGRVEWNDTATFPATAVRADAVRIAYTAGYAMLPEKCKYSILLMLTALFSNDQKEIECAKRSAGWMLEACDWGSYA